MSAETGVTGEPTPREGITVKVLDHATGEEAEQYVPPGDYILLTTDPAEASFQTYANGTHVITVKGRTQS